MITKTCLYCGKLFEVPNYRGSTAKYCSHSCLRLGTATEKTVALTCLVCKKTFYTSKIYKTRARFCSKECAQRARVSYGTVETECIICHTIFYQSPSHKRKFCSTRCYHTHKLLKPSNSPLEARNKLKRLNIEKKCVICGYNKYPQIVNIHHIDGNRNNNDWSNLTFLCPNCHAIHHQVQQHMFLPTLADIFKEMGLLE